MVFNAAPDATVWKPVSGNAGMYRPRLSSKAGKEIGKRLTVINRRMPTGDLAAKAIGMKVFGDGGPGFVWRTPGLSWVGKRVLVSTPDDYDPPKHLAADIKRISDVQWERLNEKAGAL
jgi:hypothetical protein